MIELPNLPYPQEDLVPLFSKKTVHCHYNKHHSGYVDNLNKLIQNTIFENKDLEYIVLNATGVLYNNAAQVWNHNFFWKCLKPNAEKLDQHYQIAKQINNHFGNFDTFKTEFTKAATSLFGSGWVWLVDEGDVLKIKKMKNANEPLSRHMVPLLVCDLWEHSYYLDYQNNRSRYVHEFFELVDWKFVEENLQTLKVNLT